MKKRWAMGLLCCLLLFQLAFPAKAAGSVYFVAAEESVLPVTDATMPFWANGYLYVPASVFTNLGISVINNTAKKMTVLEKDRRAMLFDWAKGTAQDSSGSLFTPGVIQSGGLVFVPASTVANFFGLQYSVTDVTNGYLVWLRSPDFGMSAKDFANAATYNMEERYNAYNRDATSSTTPNVPVTPSAPTRGARIHLCLEADQRTSGLLDALDRANGWATFYCTPDFLESNGDSVVVIEDDDVANCHVHTADPGMMLSEAIKYGYLTNFKIENMHEQFLARQKQAKGLEKQAEAEEKAAETGAKETFVYAAVDPDRAYGFVAVAAGDGLKSVFEDLGVDAVVSGGQTMNPATEDILAAIQSVPAKTVLVLPNNKNIIMAAEQAEKLADRKVLVLPTRTVPQGMTAMLNFDPEAAPEENAVNMMAAAEKVATGLITYAARDSEFDGRPIRKGEIMALENGKIVATGSDITKMTYRLARSMKKKDSQFITVISGAEVSEEDAEHTTELVQSKCGSSVEVSHIHGGQPVYYYMLSVE